MTKTAFAAGLAALLAAGTSRAVDKIAPDPRGVKLVNDLLNALNQQDEAERLKLVLPLVHKSLRTEDGMDLARNIKEFSYKKAGQNAKFYKHPIEIHEVHKGKPTTIGFKNTAEKGRIDWYIIRKKEGVGGIPAPVSVFWPEDGGEPRIVEMGSL